MSTNAPAYLESLDSFVRIYISLFLLIRFNPFQKIVFTDLDRKIGFSAGLFLFTTTTINHVMITYFDKFKTRFSGLEESKLNTSSDSVKS